MCTSMTRHSSNHPSDVLAIFFSTLAKVGPGHGASFLSNVEGTTLDPTKTQLLYLSILFWVKKMRLGVLNSILFFFLFFK
jgi:hypothetical protein